MRSGKIDKIFLWTSVALVTVGITIFISASLGLLSRSGELYSAVVFNHLFFGLGLGSIAFIVTSHIHYRKWRTYSLHIFAASLLFTVLVFVPGIGFKHGGASRWIDLGFTSMQPSELLKMGYLFYLAAWLSGAKEKVTTVKKGLLPFVIITGIVGGIMLMQPDTATFGVMVFGGLAMYIVAGARWKHLAALAFGGAAILAILIFQRPYLMQRVQTFLDPASNATGSGYQIQQSLIAIGSGQLTGRGFGQSIQKFNFLPEPIGDSIFAVASEEFGFVGSLTIILVICFFALQTFKIATRAPDPFGGLLAVGIGILMVSQSFVNIASMLGVIPLSGLPLVFVSHGGTALFCSLAELGILCNISKYRT